MIHSNALSPGGRLGLNNMQNAKPALKNCCRPKPHLLLPILALELIANSIHMVKLPEIFLDEFRRDDGSPNFLQTISALTISNVFGALAGFFLGPFWGALSDARGRKPFLVLTVILVVFPNFILALVKTFELSVWFYFAARNIHSCASSSLGIAFAYIADCTDENERHTRFSWAVGAMGFGLAVGPWIGYVLQDDLWVYNASAIASLVAILWAILLLPESHPEKYRDSITTILKSWRTAHGEGMFNPCSFIFDVFSDRFVTLTALMVGFAFLSLDAITEVILIYVGDSFRDNPIKLTELLSVLGIAVAITNFFLLPILLRFMQTSHVIVLGLAFAIIHCLLYAFANVNVTSLFVTFSLVSIAILAYPANTALLSLYVTHQDQGKAQGAIVGVECITAGFGPVIFGALHGFFTSEGYTFIRIPGAPFLLGAVFIGVATAISMVVVLNIADIFGPEELPDNVSQHRGTGGQVRDRGSNKGGGQFSRGGRVTGGSYLVTYDIDTASESSSVDFGYSPYRTMSEDTSQTSQSQSQRSSVTNPNPIPK